MAYIVLYADEFPIDVWKDYCDICKEEHNATSLTIKFDPYKDVEAEYDDKDDDCDDEDD